VRSACSALSPGPGSGITKGVEDAGDADLHAGLVLVGVTHGLRHTLALIVAGAGALRAWGAMGGEQCVGTAALV